MIGFHCFWLSTARNHDIIKIGFLICYQRSNLTLDLKDLMNHGQIGLKIWPAFGKFSKLTFSLLLIIVVFPAHGASLAMDLDLREYRAQHYVVRVGTLGSSRYST